MFPAVMRAVGMCLPERRRPTHREAINPQRAVAAGGRVSHPTPVAVLGHRSGHRELSLVR